MILESIDNKIYNKQIFSVGIIGFGLIGQKRADHIGRGRIIAVADIDESKFKLIRDFHKIIFYTNWRDLVINNDIDIVIIATTHDLLAEIAIAALNSGKHVFIEKPAARNTTELDKLINISKLSNKKIRVGFNHRYHRSVLKAKEIINSNEIGELMYIRARYGHGGRFGYEKEWRANSSISGGGELIDQGSHLIDLSRMFLGEFVEINGLAQNFYWGMDVEDNGFMLLKNANKQVSFLHVSCTEWKNIFSMEIYGKLGKIDLNGLGGSYGTERITFYKMLPEMGPPETLTWEYPMLDNSWGVELEEFYDDIQFDRSPSVDLIDAYQSLIIIENIYKESGYDYST
jgi:predicted dehydrogenase